MSSQLLGGVLAVVHLVHVLSVQYARADRHVDSVCHLLPPRARRGGVFGTVFTRALILFSSAERKRDGHEPQMT